MDDVVYSEETPEVDDKDMEENKFKTDSENKRMVSKPLGWKPLLISIKRLP